MSYNLDINELEEKFYNTSTIYGWTPPRTAKFSVRYNHPLGLTLRVSWSIVTNERLTLSDSLDVDLLETNEVVANHLDHIVKVLANQCVESLILHRAFLLRTRIQATSRSRALKRQGLGGLGKRCPPIQ